MLVKLDIYHLFYVNVSNSGLILKSEETPIDFWFLLPRKITTNFSKHSIHNTNSVLHWSLWNSHSISFYHMQTCNALCNTFSWGKWFKTAGLKPSHPATQAQMMRDSGNPDVIAHATKSTVNWTFPSQQACGKQQRANNKAKTSLQNEQEEKS